MQVRLEPDQHKVVLEELPFEEKQERDNEFRHEESRHEEAGRLFMAWEDDELAVWFPSFIVSHLRKLNTEDELLRLDIELGRYFDSAFNLIAYGSPDGQPSNESTVEKSDADESGDVEPSVTDLSGDDSEAVSHRSRPGDSLPRPDESSSIADRSASGNASDVSSAHIPESQITVTEEERLLGQMLVDPKVAPQFTRVEPEFLADVIGRPIEDWMIFLHPDQQAAVKRNYNGPARVRGGAGTGKTVVGLHRAARLAKRNYEARQQRKSQLFGAESSPALPVLFTTYIKTLPPVFEALLKRLPGAHTSEVEFINVDKLAWRLCSESGVTPHIVFQDIDRAFDIAFDSVVVPGTPLHKSNLSKNYLRDEIQRVIKGRALDSVDEYLSVARVGRRVPMRSRQREQLWDLMNAWDTEMQHLGVMDFCDVITRALEFVRTLHAPRYSAVIVDEAQDLTLAGLQMLRGLVNAPDFDHDRPDGLLIIGDGAQRIYPGGFTLRQAGVEVRGRTTVLTENYRNTNQIVSAALAATGNVEVHDLDEKFQRSSETTTANRQGPVPLLIKAVGLDAQIDDMAKRINALNEGTDTYGSGDIAILAPSRADVNAIEKKLRQRGVATQSLENYTGVTSSAVKVGTYNRAKGLEFKVVILPQLTKNKFPKSHRRQTRYEASEYRELQISKLFVAMTRARDQIVAYYDWEPSEIIQQAIDHFNTTQPLR